MAKLVIALIFVLYSATFFFFCGKANKEALFQVEGKVYCDTCRVQFETKISEPISGATVKLECKNLKTEKVTYSVMGKSDVNGQYTLTVKNDHEMDICEVSVAGSPREDCNDPIEEKTEVVCTNNSGMHDQIRFANPLGYMKKEPDSECQEILNELGFLDLQQ